MVARSAVRLLVVAGTLVPATVASGIASGGPAWAQLPTTTTTVTLPTTTTTSTTSSTTTTAPPVTTSTTSTTADPGGTSTTTTAPGGTATSTTTTDPGDGDDVLTGGGLSISVPAAAELSAGTPVNAGVVTANLGAVTVTDGRSGLVAGWTVSVTGSNFSTGGGTPAETIPVADVAYWSGPATATSGPAAFAPGQADQAHARSLAMPCTAFSALSSSGGTSATWNPGLVVTLPPTVVTGQYHGTITHSVA